MNRREFLAAASALTALGKLARLTEAGAPTPIRLAHLGSHEGRFNKGGLTLVSGYSPEGHYMAGQAVAELLSRHVGGARTDLVVVATPTDALRFLRAGRTRTAYGEFSVELALIEGDELHLALNGADGSSRPAAGVLRLLTELPPHVLHIITLRESPIEGIAALAGKTVSIGPTGSRSECITRRLLEAYDLSAETSLQQKALPLAASMKALAARTIDAFAWHGPVSPVVIEHLTGLLGTRITLVPHGEAVVRLQAKYGPAHFAATVRKGAYSWLEKDIQVVGTQNLLLSRADLPTRLAYDIVRTLQAHPEAFEGSGRSVSGEPPASALPLPMHPGAKKF